MNGGRGARHLHLTPRTLEDLADALDAAEEQADTWLNQDRARRELARHTIAAIARLRARIAG